MSKYRVFELAREFHTESKVVLSLLERNGHKVKNHMSSVGDEEREMLRGIFSGEASKQNSAKPAQPEKKADKPNTVKEQKKEQGKPNEGAHKTHDNHAAPVQKNASVKNEAPHKNNANNNASHVQTQPKPSQHNKNGNVQSQSSEQNMRQQHGKKVVSKNAVNTATSNKKHANMDDNRNANKKHRPENQNGGRPNNTMRNNGGHSQNQNDKNNSDVNNRHHASNDNRNNNRHGDTNNNRDNNNNHRSNNNQFNNRNFNRDNRNNKKNKKNRNQQQQPKTEIIRPKHIKIGETIAVKDLASKMSYTAAEVVKKLFLMGVMATINQEIDFDTAALVAGEFGVTAEALPPETDPTEIPEIEDDPKTLVLRPPVVTVMGHVDHGKTSLLDVIRKSSVSAHEAGGITQKIGAYQVNCKGKKIIFLDTPGHEAFTAMRARGAQVTDIAILVVAADDGVMPQTIEAIHHAKAAGVPIIVAINKIDKPGANPDLVKKELMEQGLVPEEWGGETIMVPVSAKKKIGIDDLLEMVLLVAEMQELKANPNRDARGVIIEAQLDKGRGPVATVLVQNGTLRIGDSIIAGTTYGKVRAMINDRGENVKKAPPSMPVEVLGLSGVPEAGDKLAVLDEKLTRSIAEKRIEKQRNALIKAKKVSLDDLFQQIQEGNIKDLNIVIKADVQGSVEALTGSLLALNKNDEVRVSIVHSGVGAVNESDVMLASAANAIIIAFNVRPDANARKVADTESVDIRQYQVIYDALNDVKAAMTGMLAPKYKEVIQGKVEIRQVMKFSKVLVAGCYVSEGKITNNSKIRIIRDNIVVHDGEVDSLRRFKDDVKEVASGFECGLTIKDYRDFKEGDILEVYTMEEIATSIAEANARAAEKQKADTPKE
ncbi:MAG: translation initiation factor IF-2 [Selenomonadaceae bacterium]